MSYLIEHQYVILYFSGAFFSFFAMLSYVKIGSTLMGGKRKMGNHEDFFDDFDNDDLEALLDESFDPEEPKTPTSSSSPESAQLPTSFLFTERNLEIENDKPLARENSKPTTTQLAKSES